MARKILLADDSVTAQNMGRKILADAGYDVVTVNNGSAALKRVAEIKPDLIVLDVYMPGYSGLEVCQRLKDADETAHIPVLLTVGKLEPFKPEEARRVKADAHIVKPFEASELLTAITRLEDRMVPQQSEGGRFNTSSSSADRLSGDGSGRKTEGEAPSDTGWKSRLRFPSKKKKEESEDASAGASFRDFRKAKNKDKEKEKTDVTAAFTVKEPASSGQEPAVVPDIPRDITPAELDALSALVEKLDGTIPAIEDVAPQTEEPGLVETPAAELATVETTVDETPAAAPTAVVEAMEVVDTPAIMTEPKAVEAEAPASAVESKIEVEIPVEHVELATDAVANQATDEDETHQPEVLHSETPLAEVAVSVNTALFAQDPAPIDRDDEPMFGLAESAAAQALEEKIEEIPAEAAAATTVMDAATAIQLESQPEESKVENQAENIEQPVPAATTSLEAAHTEEPPPSDEELAEALRWLTPSSGQGNGPAIPSHGTLVAAGHLLAAEAACNSAAGPRWIAEPVMLSPEEATISLEAEMFSTLAAPAASEVESAPLVGVSAIAAAVEHRLAAELAASAYASAEQAGGPYSTECSSPENLSETSSETSVAEANAAMAPAATFANAAVENEAEAPIAQSIAQSTAQSTAQSIPQSEEHGGEALVAVATEQEDQDSSSDSGGGESMGKAVKSKSGKSNGHQIRASRSDAAGQSEVSGNVEIPKQAEYETGEPQKAMAAAAAEGSASATITDASTIASIVDSVMADLRPRIVEEIARKLAGK